MLCINKCCLTTKLLCLSNCRKRKSCFSGCFRPINFNNSSSGKPPDTKRQIDRGARMTAVLLQKNASPMPFEKATAVIYAAVNGYLARVPVNTVPQWEEKFLAFLEARGSEVLDSVERARDLSPQSEEELKDKLKEFEETHPGLYAAQ